MRRALIAMLLAASAACPAVAQAQQSLLVTAVAKGYHGGFENMNVQFECAAAAAGATATVTRCTFGKVSAPSLGPVAIGSTNVRLGLPYDLCVTAVSGAQTVTRCAPYSYLTNTAVVAG